MRIQLRKVCFAAWPLLLWVGAHGQDWKNYPYYPPATLLAFPNDDGNHPEYNEWWYLNFHLTDTLTDERYSGMVAVFDVPIPFRILNIANESTGIFRSVIEPSSLTSPGSLTAHPDSMAIYFEHSGSIDTILNKLDAGKNLLPFQYYLRVGDESNNLTLNLDVQKRPLMQGNDGLVIFMENSSFYYSYTSIAAKGSVTLDGVRIHVAGSGWFDHQYGPFLHQGYLDFSEVNYEWFSVQLSNSYDICFWQTFIGRQLTHNYPDQFSTIYISEDMQDTTSVFSLQRTGFWRAPSGNFYSSGWHYTDPLRNIELTITPTMEEQIVSHEISPLEFYEGSCDVVGQVDGTPVTGQAFAELLHIYHAPKLSFLNPGSGIFVPDTVRWAVTNPDDGNPLQFDLLYSEDQDSLFHFLVRGIYETEWLYHGEFGTGARLKLVAYSVDSTIVSEIISEPLLITTVIERRTGYQKGFTLNQNFPNPFNPETEIRFRLPQASQVVLKIYNTSGQEIRILADTQYEAGFHILHWDGKDSQGNSTASGVYLYRLQAGCFSQVRKMSLLR